MAPRSWSDDSGLSLSPPEYRALGELTARCPISTEEIWDIYFESGSTAYQGLDKEWMQNTVSGSETVAALPVSLFQKCDPSRQASEFHLSAEKGSSAVNTDGHNQVEEALLRQPEGAVSDVTGAFERTGKDLADMIIIGRSSSSSDGRGRPADDHETRDQILEALGNEVEECKDCEGVDCQLACKSDCYSQEGLLKALTHETEDLLRIPLNPDSLDSVSEAGFPVGVEKARNAYDQGLLSTGTFFRDCLPPALSCSKAASSSGSHTITCSSPQGQATSTREPLLLSRRSARGENWDSIPASRPRNISNEEQFRRINQPPLSAIYEESDLQREAVEECPCDVCKHRPNGRGIVWFHLCPCYKALAQENGIKYEPYEGRLIMHHGSDRSSLGLIIEGPMEDRFVPVVEQSGKAETLAAKRVKAPKPPKLDLHSIRSSVNNSRPKFTPRTVSSPKLPPVSTPSLQRPISPTRGSRPSSLHPLSSVCGPKLTGSQGDKEPASVAALGTQQDIHPAFRTGGILPQDWTTPPAPSPSQTSFHDESPQQRPSMNDEKARLSSTSSEASRLLPTRTDSLGALAHLNAIEADKSHIHIHSKHRLQTEHRTPHSTSERPFSSPLISPSAGHERTPSEYLCPSTPSTTSFQRTSTSSYGDALPTNMIHAQQEAAASAEQVTQTEDLSRPSDGANVDVNSQQRQSPFSPLSSYYTAQDGRSASSSRLPTPRTAGTAPTFFNSPRSNNASQSSPYLPSRSYHRCQVSEQSTAESLNSLSLQRNSDLTSGTTLLNGSAFDEVDETSSEDFGRISYGHGDRSRLHDEDRSSGIYTTHPLVTTGAAESRRLNILQSSSKLQNNPNRHDIPRTNPLMTVGATEAHCTTIATANTRVAGRRASVPVGPGVADSIASLPNHFITSSRINNPSTRSTANSSSSNFETPNYRPAAHSSYNKTSAPILSCRMS
ncbi:MAG: hypothetical protein Q9170_001089 [Blastenia crenularia]